MPIKDITLIDKNRRDLNLLKSDVDAVLPDFMNTEYPEFIQFLKDYYDWMQLEGNPGYQIQTLNQARDITQTDDALLTFIEDELLMGNAYIKGYINKREAAKFSRSLYKSKGTKFSIEQFFRGFFNEDPEVIYTRDNVFNLNDPASTLGPQSQRYITNAERYQTHAILIKSSLPRSLWEENYKLFVHPAGMYLSSDIVLVGANAVFANTMPDNIPAEPSPSIYEDVGLITPAIYGSVTYLTADLDNSILRQDVGFDFERYQNASYNELNNMYNSYQEFLAASGPTFDRDSDDVGQGINFSDNTYETFDRSWYDSAQAPAYNPL